jgi:hypothetical protein
MVKADQLEYMVIWRENRFTESFFAEYVAEDSE